MPARSVPPGTWSIDVGVTLQPLSPFQGSSRPVIGSLADAMLTCCPLDTQAFLQEAIVLEWFCARLFTAVAGKPDAQATLAALEPANLFLISLDEKRRWYGYHHSW